MAPLADARLQLETARLTALYGRRAAVKDVSLMFPRHTVTALIGPSGCGKTTFLRCLNRMHELSEGGWITGKVVLDGEDIYDPGVDAIRLRRRIGRVFQRPTPFATMSIFFSSRRRHTRSDRDWSSDVCSSDLPPRSRRGSCAFSLEPGARAE